MKYYSIIAFIAAALHFSMGILICCGKCKGFVNGICKNTQRYKILGRYFIMIGGIMLSCGIAALTESNYTIIYLAVASVLISIFVSLIRREAQ